MVIIILFKTIFCYDKTVTVLYMSIIICFKQWRYVVH